MAPRLIYIPVTVATLLILRYFVRRRAKRLPPGPKGRFFVGNLSDLPRDETEKANTYVKWREDYGSIMHLEVFGRHMIILNTAQAAHDLMDKRAAIYSNRPRMIMFVELMGNSWVLSSISGEPHRERRSLAQRYFLAQIKDWQLVQLQSSRTLVRNLFANPNDWVALIRLGIASSILRICYGHEITDPNDPLLKIVQDALETPRNGPYLVDLFPLLKYYPSWFPGGGFKKDAAEAGLMSRRLRHVPFDMVRSQMAAGTASSSFISTLLSQLPPDEDPEHSRQAGLIRDTAAVMYGAAMDSTVSFMYTFLGAMVLRPEIQRRAQIELDSVLGQDHMPTFEDRSSLPFIDCIVLEVFRWNAITPLGFPHMVIQEDEYLGYHIPKGSQILGNTWAILRDPEAFPNPDQFDPSRFLVTTKGNATAREVIESTVFGWGRRTCPGRHVGHSALFIFISHILACFDIAKPVDDAGNEFEPVLEFDSRRFVRQALPTPCTIRPRSDKIATLLAHTE
ncbi:cytochrome P450 [Boletus coccyginus]|nr:cytochrome P450 [Boletus coccyginus]